MEADNYIFKTYARYPITLVEGKGAWLFDSNKNKYLDFMAGIAVCSLGHANEQLAETLSKQYARLSHVSNLYYNEPQTALSKWLIESSCFDRAFFCNSGAEANEGACKLARMYAHKVLGVHEPVILTAQNSFHGRTLAMLTATAQPKYQKGFEPLMPGFEYIPYNDVNGFHDVVNRLETAGRKVAAILIEPIQGEGGVTPGTIEYLRALREYCSDNKALLIFDEIQCGVGRAGTFWTYELLGIEPDILTSAKGLGGGFPVGAFLAKEFCSVFEPGDHGTTYGGNPLACAVAYTVCKTVSDNSFLSNVTKCGEVLRSELSSIVANSKGMFGEVRGLGLINGMTINSDSKTVAGDVVNACIKEGLLVIPAGPKVVRMVPPLIITEDEIKDGVGRLKQAISAL